MEHYNMKQISMATDMKRALFWISYYFLETLKISAKFKIRNLIYPKDMQSGLI